VRVRDITELEENNYGSQKGTRRQERTTVASRAHFDFLRNATSEDPEERMQAETILAFTDRERVSAIQTAQSDIPPAQAAVPRAISTAIDNATLPPRIYLQISNTDDESNAEAARTGRRNAGIIVPASNECLQG